MDEAQPPHTAAEDFDRFYNASVDQVMRQIALMTGNPAEAEDVVQEAFERAWLQWPTVRECNSPEAWVRTVARRLAVSRWRRARNASVAWLRSGPIRVQHDAEPENAELIEALRQLPMAQRVAIVLHHLGDLSVAQVAAETGASISAVKQQLSRGRAALAARLSDETHSRPGPRQEETP